MQSKSLVYLVKVVLVFFDILLLSNEIYGIVHFFFYSKNNHLSLSGVRLIT